MDVGSIRRCAVVSSAHAAGASSPRTHTPNEEYSIQQTEGRPANVHGTSVDCNAIFGATKQGRLTVRNPHAGQSGRLRGPRHDLHALSIHISHLSFALALTVLEKGTQAPLGGGGFSLVRPCAKEFGGDSRFDPAAQQITCWTYCANTSWGADH